jgi:hypothetical protein
MTRSGAGIPAASILAALLLTAWTPAAAVTVAAGWTRADLGLQDKGDGIFLGVSNDIPVVSRILDASYALEYVQKVGSQPTFFSDPVSGFLTDEAEVTLHCLQPALFLGARVPDLGFVPRIYVGGSLVLKVKESWSDFPGQADREWGYKNSDIVGHVGVSLQVGPVLADFRFSQGLTGQLLQDNSQVVLGAKAEVGPEGDFEPRIGAKLSHFQLGAGFRF